MSTDAPRALSIALFALAPVLVVLALFSGYLHIAVPVALGGVAVGVATWPLATPSARARHVARIGAGILAYLGFGLSCLVAYTSRASGDPAVLAGIAASVAALVLHQASLEGPSPVS